MKKLINILKVTSVLLLLVIPFHTSKGISIFFGIGLVIMLYDMFESLMLNGNLFIVAPCLLGIMLIFFKNKHYTLLGYFLTSISLISLYWKSNNYKEHNTVFFMALYFILEIIVLFLVYRKSINKKEKLPPK